jgi:hypothetical protein
VSSGGSMEKSEIEIKKSQLCLQCMACCKKLVMALPDMYVGVRLVAKEFYEARGHRVRYSLIHKNFYIVFDEVCPHLTKKGCDIYDTPKMPLNCKIFDGRNHEETRGECLWNKLDKEMSNFDTSLIKTKEEVI